MGIRIGKSSSRSQPRRRKTWLCVIAVVASSLGGAPAAAATPTVPAAPTITSVKAIGLNSVTVAFAKPADGGARIASYRATCTSTNRGVRGAHDAARSPIRVPGLTENKTYVCTVAASNDVGAGRASARSSPVVVRPTPPSAPTVMSVKAIGSRAITVAFTKPADDGGAPIMNYRATCTSTAGGVDRSRVAAQSPINVADLTADEMYRCTVAAGNRVGLGRASARSSPVLAHPTAPGMPTITSVKAIGLRSIMVAFTKPVDDGGTPIRHYVVECTSTNGGAPRSGHASASPIRVSDLTSKKTYRCTVAANNDVRLGPSSPPSKPVVARF
ncbi:MAG: fibronectin type III domain-containing protein [Acidimicrobiia bacterium]